MGYIGLSRSERSQRAIEGYEVPVSMINRDLINKYLNDNIDCYSPDELIKFKKVPVTIFKYIANSKIRFTSWHHTGKFYNKTYHYNLVDIFNYINEQGLDSVKLEYKDYKDEVRRLKEEERKDFKFAIIKVKIWGGTRKHPKITGYETELGIIVGDWFYYKGYSKLKKYNPYSNKVEWCKAYDTYKDFIKENKNYTNTKKDFMIIKKMVLK